jgi:hypothetical protein
LFQLYTSQILLKPSQAKTIPKQLFTTTYDDVFPAPNVKSLNFLLYYFPILIDLNVNLKIKELSKSTAIDSYKKTLFSHGKFHLGCLMLSSILLKNYGEKGIIENETRIKTELESNADFHFINALENLEKIIKAMVGNKKESIAGASRMTDLDNRVAKFVYNRKST